MLRWLLLVAAACSHPAREPTIWDPPRESQPFRPEWCASPPTVAAPAATPAATDWLDVRDNLVCTSPAHTKGANSGGCGEWLDLDFFLDTLHAQHAVLPCGPCGADACARATAEARAHTSDACCYITYSPSRG
jgi:hypothetical protein